MRHANYDSIAAEIVTKLAGIPRDKVGIIWCDVLEERMDDEMPGKPVGECLQELIRRADTRDKLDELLEVIRDEFPDRL